MVQVAGGRKVCVFVVYVYPSLPHCHQHAKSLHYQDLVVSAAPTTAHQALVATADRCSAEGCKICGERAHTSRVRLLAALSGAFLVLSEGKGDGIVTQFQST